MGSIDRNQQFEDCVGVFQGGGCRAAAYAGAYSSMIKHGVNLHELAGASAGAIAAVLIAAGAEPDWLEAKLSSLDFRKLVDKPEGRFATKGKRWPGMLWNLARFNGVHSSAPVEAWLEASLREILPTVVTTRVRFCDLPKPVWVIAADLNSRQPIVWSTETTPEYSVADAVRASCSIPFFFQPHRGSYADGGMISNLPLHLIRNDDSDPRRILAIRLIDAPDMTPRRNVKALLSSVMSTVVDGGQHVQSELVDHVSTIYISCGDVKATDFDKMTPERVQVLVDAGRQAADDFFGRGPQAAAPVRPPVLSTQLAQTLTMAVDLVLRAQRHILVSTPTTSWVFDLYTALLVARMRSIPVQITLPEYAGSESDKLLQRDTLRALGCEVIETPASQPQPIEAWVCDPGSYNARAVVLSENDVPIDARLLTAGDGDEKMIALIAESIAAGPVADSTKEREFDSHPSDGVIRLLPAPADAVTSVLARVEQYSAGQQFALESIPLERIDAWARYAHIYKQRQQEVMLRALRSHGFDEFVPFYVDYGTGHMSLAMPVIVEESGEGSYTVVNGVSRLVELYRERSTHAQVIVVRGVTADPPADSTRRLSDLGVRVGIRGKHSDRYPGFVYENMRHVEKEAHQLLPVVKETGGEGQ